MALVDLLRRGVPMQIGALQSWLLQLERVDKTACVHAALASARTALVVWEQLEPDLRAPHDRIAAADAWLACPCEAHADAAGSLAFANGVDNPMKSTSLVVDGRSIEPMEAIYAHWSADNACSTAWCRDLHYAAQAASTGAGAAHAALVSIDETNAAARIRAAIVEALVPLASADVAERTLLLAMADGDAASREVYADWLEQRGQLDAANELRGVVTGEG